MRAILVALPSQPADLSYNDTMIQPRPVQKNDKKHQFTLLGTRMAHKHNPSKDLLVVTRPLDAQVRRHRHILNNNTLPIPTRNPNIRLRSSNPTRDLKEVVISPLRRLPRLAAIDRDFELGRPAVGVDHLRGEPVLRHAGFEVDGERAGDGGAAVDELVRGVDDALGGVGLEGRPGVLEEVDVAGVAFGAFVYDLFF